MQGNESRSVEMKKQLENLVKILDQKTSMQRFNPWQLFYECSSKFLKWTRKSFDNTKLLKMVEIRKGLWGLSRSITSCHWEEPGFIHTESFFIHTEYLYT